MDAKCPVAHGAVTQASGSDNYWFPKSLNLDILNQQDSKTPTRYRIATTRRTPARRR